MRIGTAVAVLGLIAATGARAADLTGSWQVRGAITANGVTLASLTPVCELKQAEGKVSGVCEGPNSAGPASGVVDKSHVALEWRPAPTTGMGMNGVAAFEGDLGADGVVHGRWTFSGLPGLTGDFSLTRR